MWSSLFGGDSPRLHEFARSLYSGSSKQAPDDERSNVHSRPASTPYVKPWQQSASAAARGAPCRAGAASSSADAATAGRPAKQTQQEEVLAPLDDNERAAQQWRQHGQHGAGRFATARPGSTAAKCAPPSYDAAAALDGELAAPTGGPTGTSRGYRKGCAGYSARPSGLHSPTRQRAQALTARCDEEHAARLEWERQQKERARRAAQRAALLATEREKAEEERRQEARREAEQRLAVTAERERVATQSARVRGLPPMNVAKAMKPVPTMRARAAKKRAQRPEWGQGHAGGTRLKRDVRVFAASPPGPPAVRV
jgi:hypothetical protein